MSRPLFFLVAGLATCLTACASLTVAPPYVAAGSDIPQDQLARLIVHNEKDTAPSLVPYEWIASDYAVVTRLDYKSLGKSGALLGSAVTGDYDYPSEVDFPAGPHMVTIGVMTGCGLMELDTQLDAKAGVTYDAYGIFKSSYAAVNGSIGGCQARAPIMPRKPD